ncbi:MAG: hypothetical protein WCY73_03245, partial [Bacteroidales bacterium]
MRIKEIPAKIWEQRFLIPLTLAVLCLVLSFFELTSHNSRMKRLVQVEKVLHRKQHVIENIALQELEQDPMADLSERDVAGDMVVYKYYRDSLISWVNTFPIINDSYSPGAMFPNFSFFSRNTILHQPLSGVEEKEQYMNLGSAWYVVKAYKREDVTLITGILIRTDFPFSNSFV